ncbi:pyridoxal-phosphate dependent enzyme [Streptomyces sp. H10-C2]|uniref:pyridoxal-phosphate dependent enzyme n=1 Tax=unclassified Streptomyces TaxID=2593676 RepID=UPI0024B9FB12|nr:MULTISPECIES: pyridoxal-phosphate dependent enzyme [unclassified Streptomyces]MDJ0343038.1 pyridoxal-phosphate dependent enzyme [Streptomyces sp. PH10-H1]MDJ0372782.1 pyridoxal-phosphate dependent enzyme [Streptomyces sp. H10-C2]
MAVYESVTDAIGGTPLFRLARLGDGISTPVYAKAEFLNIGGSVKDRAALSMVEEAERAGLLRPGGTIIEATSGNTGIGLAIVGRQRGYRVVVGVSDRAAREKSDILRAYGAEVVLAPTALSKDSPDHLFHVVRRLAEEIPGAWLANQYDNPANPDAHVRTTGPEIWEQTGGRVTHFVAGVGTGGTISGTGGFLQKVSGGQVTVVGADPEASVYSGGDGSAYFVESIGHFVHPETQEDVWPESYHQNVVDRFERVPDRESLLTARRMAREEGLLVGPSSGTAVAAALRVARRLGPDDLVVVLLPDSGRSYLSSALNDDWLRQRGFLEEPRHSGDTEPTVRTVLGDAPDRGERLVTVPSAASLGEALTVLRAGHATVAPVVLARAGRPFGISATEIIGSVESARLQVAVDSGAARPEEPLRDHLGPALPIVGVGQPLSSALASLDTPGHRHEAAVVLLDGRAYTVVHRSELQAGPTATRTPY